MPVNSVVLIYSLLDCTKVNSDFLVQNTILDKLVGRLNNPRLAVPLLNRLAWFGLKKKYH